MPKTEHWRQQFLDNLPCYPSVAKYVGSALNWRVREEHFLANPRIRWIALADERARWQENYLSRVSSSPEPVQRFEGIFRQLPKRGNPFDFDDRLEDAFTEVYLCDWLQIKGFTRIEKLREDGITPDFSARFGGQVVYAEAKNSREREPDLALIGNLLRSWQVRQGRNEVTGGFLEFTEKFHELREGGKLPTWGTRRKQIITECSDGKLGDILARATSHPCELGNGLYKFEACEGLRGAFSYSGGSRFVGQSDVAIPVLTTCARILGTVAAAGRQLWGNVHASSEGPHHVVFIRWHSDLSDLYALDVALDTDHVDWNAQFGALAGHLVSPVWPNCTLVVHADSRVFWYSKLPLPGEDA